MSKANSTDQTNPEQCRHLGVDTIQELVKDYRTFVVGKASAASEGKYPQIQQGCIGLSTESGELLDNLKKSMFQGRAFDVVNAKEECGDALFYITELLDALDSDIFECMALNMRKLTARYGDNKFNKDKSLNRDTDKERVILEGADQECSTCADTFCSNQPYPQRRCKGYINNRNYPIEALSVASSTAPVACCSNCAVKLQLGGCSGDARTNDDNCCKDHKFL